MKALPLALLLLSVLIIGSDALSCGKQDVHFIQLQKSYPVLYVLKFYIVILYVLQMLREARIFA